MTPSPSLDLLDRRVRLAWSQPIWVHGQLSASRARMVRRHLPGRVIGVQMALAAAMLHAEPALPEAALRLAGAAPGMRAAGPPGAVALPMRSDGKIYIYVCM